MAEETLNQQTEKDPPSRSDFLALWDVAAGAFKKVTIQNVFDLLDIEDAWDPWSPSWTNLDITKASSVVTRYKQVGSNVYGRISLNCSNATSFITGAVQFTLPVTPHPDYDLARFMQIGSGMIHDNGTRAYYAGVVLDNADDKPYIMVMSTATTYVSHTQLSSTVPMTWAANDDIAVQFMYQVA